MTTRRSLLGALGAIPAVALLARCAANSTIPAQVVSDLQIAVNGLTSGLNSVAAASPNAIPAATVTTIQADLKQAAAVLVSLSTNTPVTTGATTAQSVVSYINAGLAVLADPPVNGLIPAPFNTAIAAFDLVLPSIEAFVESVMPSTTGATPAVAKAVAVRLKSRAMLPAMTTADQARAALAALSAKKH